jgi:hypothetical protein
MHNGGLDFQNQYPDWHSQVADIFIKTKPSPMRRGLLLVCKSCCNIPIKDRVLKHNVTWVSMSSAKEVYFKHRDSERPIPNGLSMLVVDEHAVIDFIRRDVFCELGVQVCNQDKICEKIQSLHNEIEGLTFDLETCILHAVYLSNQVTDLMMMTG